MSYQAYRREARRDERKPVALSEGPGWHPSTPRNASGQAVHQGTRGEGRAA